MRLTDTIKASFFLSLFLSGAVSGDELLKKGFDLIREGDSYFKEGEPSAAYQRYMEALKIFPTWFLPNLRLGIVSKHLGLSDETVLSYFKWAYEFEPENSDVHYHLGVFLMEKGDSSGGEVHFKKCAGKENKDLRCWLALAQSLSKQNKISEAIMEYEEIISRYPTCEPALSALADLYIGKGEFAKALDKLTMLLKVSNFPSRVTARINLIRKSLDNKKNP